MAMATEAINRVNCGESYEYTDAQDIPSGTTALFLITTPDTTKWGHFIYEFDAELELEVRFYGGATPDTDGTIVSKTILDEYNLSVTYSKGGEQLTLDYSYAYNCKVWF